MYGSGNLETENTLGCYVQGSQHLPGVFVAVGRAVWWVGMDRNSMQKLLLLTHAGIYTCWKRKHDEEHQSKICRVDIPNTTIQQTHKSNLSQRSYKLCLVQKFQDKLFQLFNFLFLFQVKLSKGFNLRSMHHQMKAKLYLRGSRGD